MMVKVLQSPGAPGVGVSCVWSSEVCLPACRAGKSAMSITTLELAWQKVGKPGRSARAARLGTSLTNGYSRWRANDAVVRLQLEGKR